jgi:tetratricopeptide (TPR) repeat protein
MLAKLSVDQALMKAKFHLKKNEKTEAQKIYQVILKSFPKNLQAQHELAILNKRSKNNITESPSQVAIDQLVHLYNQRQFSVVVKLSQNITNQYPESIIVWNILGVSAAEIDMLDVAIKAYKMAISLKPDYAEAYNNMGNALVNQGKLDKAIEACNKAISLKPDYAEAYNNMGNALKYQGKLQKSVEVFNKALAIKPDYAEAYNNMGNALQDQGELDKAIEVYNKAVSLKPYLVVTYNNLGNAFKDQGKLDEAIELYNKALFLKPDYAEAYSNMGSVLKDQGKLDKAIEVYKKAILLKPDYVEAYGNMGNALQEQGELDKAIETFNKVILLKPDNIEALNNLGNAFKDQGELDKAIETFNKAILLKPDYAEAHQNLSFALLSAGKLKEGLDEYEWRWKDTNSSSLPRCFLKPMWDGKKSLKDKRILLWSEQGIGDIINWSSFLSLMSSQSEHCILECQEKLVPLLERSFPNIEVKSENKNLDKDRKDFDLHLPMGSLYKNFIKELSQNNKPKAFLIPNPVRVRFWKERLSALGKGPYIGISWKSANMSYPRPPNYCQISDLTPIITIPNVTIVNLQYVNFKDDLNKIIHELGIPIHNFDDLDHYNNIDDVAALCSALDIVISTKTTVPLISAGVGTLTKLANWRQSPWNNILLNPVGPSVHIYEKDAWEPWDDVFNLIREDVLKLTKNWSSYGKNCNHTCTIW